MVTSVGREYFDEMYARSPDPWSFQTRWYEHRKRALTLAALPQRRFTRCYEPGCSIGLLTHELALRCEEVIADDLHAGTVEAARLRNAEFAHVTVTQRRVPQEWPTGEFDLIVVSELAYYFDTSERDRLWERVAASLTADGVVVAVHWRPQVAEYPTNGDTVHRELRACEKWHSLARYEDDDLMLDVLAQGARASVAALEGLW
ncbi:MAG: SAM-dependent methyltransferase [Actinomycetes bacterium]